MNEEMLIDECLMLVRIIILFKYEKKSNRYLIGFKKAFEWVETSPSIFVC